MPFRQKLVVLLIWGVLKIQMLDRLVAGHLPPANQIVLVTHHPKINLSKTLESMNVIWIEGELRKARTKTASGGVWLHFRGCSDLPLHRFAQHKKVGFLGTSTHCERRLVGSSKWNTCHDSAGRAKEHFSHTIVIARVYEIHSAFYDLQHR